VPGAGNKQGTGRRKVVPSKKKNYPAASGNGGIKEKSPEAYRVRSLRGKGKKRTKTEKILQRKTDIK